jgi:hypothetical protein
MGVPLIEYVALCFMCVSVSYAHVLMCLMVPPHFCMYIYMCLHACMYLGMHMLTYVMCNMYAIYFCFAYLHAHICMYVRFTCQEFRRIPQACGLQRRKNLYVRMHVVYVCVCVCVRSHTLLHAHTYRRVHVYV